MCDFVFGPCFVLKFFMSFLVLKHLAEEERTACFTFIVFFLFIIEPRHEISNNVVCVTSKASDQSAHTHSLIRAFDSRLNIL